MHTLPTPSFGEMRRIVQLDFSIGIFPEDCKFAKVYPIFKGSDNHLTTNFRPILLLSLASKIAEKIVNNQFLQFFESNNILLVGLLGLSCHSHIVQNCSTFYLIMSVSSGLWPPLTQVLLQFQERQTKRTCAFIYQLSASQC